ncbi:hypothetical protein C8A00DRAFT_19230 [Chaetomidium leptoderma]|uniref:Uncharacterized protein n=1 Tax=Chaetomidium leptoderma TaxID=669021 RepID=A0AAN6VF68_9PEZI|nr:hypothetical protein C8A00DRAFT_19230 [Chaetomidium leptoderma]
MAASQSLLLETRRAEANHAEVKRRIDELARHYHDQEKQALADLDEKLKAINVQFEKQSAEIVAQLGGQSLLESVEKVLVQNRDLEIKGLRQTHQEQVNARKNVYNEQKQAYDKELFQAMTALMTIGLGPNPGHSPAFPSRPSEPEASRAVTAAAATSSRVTLAETTTAPPAATEAPSQPQQGASLGPTQIPTETDRQPILSQDAPKDPQPRSPQRFAVHSRDTPIAPHRRSTTDKQERENLTSSVQSPPAEPDVSPPPAIGHEGASAEFATASLGRQSKTTPKPDPSHKRKANGESNDQSPAAPPSRVKRAKLEKANGADRSAVDQASPVVSQENAQRTVSFEDVFGTPDKPAPHNHVIVQYPNGAGEFYILRCDEHGVHFGEHPLRGAAKHLASAQHNYMSKAHATAIETLGHRVLGCTKELADKNNQHVLKAFKDGSYKVFNANNLSQTRRTELGYPPLDPLNSQKAAMHRKQMAGITNPATCRFYYAGTGGDRKCPVLILPWGDLSPAGVIGTLVGTGIFREVTANGKTMGLPKLPKCYAYDVVDNTVTGIRGWEKGYEIGGPLEKKREFPVLCAENTDYRKWAVGWVRAAHLSVLDFDEPNSRNIPFLEEARDYFLSLPHHGQAAHKQSRKEAPNGAGEDVEMTDAGSMHNNEVEFDSDQDSVSKAMSDSDNDALNLPTPARTGFTAINNTANVSDGSASRSARASLEPPSRAGSVSSTGGGHRRVFKIHARSSNRHPTNHASPSMALPERPADTTTTLGEVRKPSPASLQNILQNFPGPAADGPSRGSSQSPKPATARRPLPSAPMRSGSPSRSALLSAVNTKLTQSLRDTRAGSAPVQLPQQRDDPVAEELRRCGSASAVPGRSRHVTPQPSAAVSAPELVPAPEPIQKKVQQPLPPIQVPLPAATFTPMLQLSTTPLATPATSVGNTRANSPALAQGKAGTSTSTTASFSKPETPSLTPTLPQPGSFLPTMDVFDLTGFMDGSAEIFRYNTPGQYLRLVDDHQSGVFTTPSDAPVSLKIEPKKIKVVERATAQNGAVCVVTITYHPGEGEGESEGRVHTLVMEKARSTASGMQNGVVHARRLCRRLVAWNPDIDFPSPSPSTSVDSIRWRFSSQSPTTPSAVAGQEQK